MNKRCLYFGCLNRPGHHLHDESKWRNINDLSTLQNFP